MRKINFSFFKGVCLAFSALLLVLTLMGSVELARMSQNTMELEKTVKEAEEKNQTLRLRVETRLSLQEIERYALEELGMQTPTEDQIVYIDYIDTAKKG